MAPGLFARHLSPGSAFALWGVYWFVNTIYVVAKRNVRHSLKQTSVLEHLSWRWEARSNFGMAEACVKIFACLSLLVVELAQGGWKPVRACVRVCVPVTDRYLLASCVSHALLVRLSL